MTCRPEVEASILLHQLNRLVDDPLQLVVVAELNEAGQWKVLAQRMTLKAVIGEDSAKVGVAGEQDAVKIECLALKPVGAREKTHKARYRVRLVGLDAHADAVIQPRAQQMVDHVEALLSVGIVGAANIDQAAEVAERIVAEQRDRL